MRAIKIISAVILVIVSIALLVLLVVELCKEKPDKVEEFEWSGKKIKVMYYESRCEYHLKDEDLEIIICDYSNDGKIFDSTRVNEEKVSFKLSDGREIVLDSYGVMRGYLTIDGVRFYNEKMVKHYANQAMCLVGVFHEGYIKYKSGDIYSNVNNVTEELEEKERLELLEKAQVEQNPKVYFTLPETGKKYTLVDSLVLLVESRSNVLRSTLSGPADIIVLERLEKKYRDLEVKKARIKGIEMIKDQIGKLGDKYIAVVDKMKITFADFDLDEKLLEKITKEGKISGSGKSKAVFGLIGGQSKIEGYYIEKSYDKKIEYIVRLLITYKVYKEEKGGMK